jgi:hypothetical protein
MSLDLSRKPSKETLDTSLGFNVPPLFVEIVTAIWSEARRMKKEANELFAALFEIPGGPESRYPGTPPELFPIASMHVDGVHSGYVIHAPELDSDDFPLGEYCPMDSGGIFLLGGGTLEAFENSMSRALRSEEVLSHPLDVETKHAIIAISAQFGLTPSAKKSSRRYGKDGNGLPVLPKIPAGWRHVQTSDGVGVFAKNSAFRPKCKRDLALLTKDLTNTIRMAKTDLHDGFAASALELLREARWNHWSDGSGLVRCNEMLIEAYRYLERDLLAKVVEKQIAPPS